MPGKKDFISIREDGKRIHLQKRLVLSNLKEIYVAFKQKFPDCKVGFSKFAELRPKQCILAGASGTHTVCVCTIHQNVKLMMNVINLPNIPTYQHCLARIICNPPRECTECPGIEKLKSDVLSILEENSVSQIIYKQWVFTDRSTLETFCAQEDEFVDVFCEKLYSH